MITLADAIVPAEVGRVLLHTVAVTPANWQPAADPTPVERAQAVLGEVLGASARIGIRTETLTTAATHPMQEIARVARLHRCESVLLGLSEISEHNQGTLIESLMGELDANVVVLRSRPGWRPAEARRILIPLAGRGGHEHLLALLLGSLSRSGPRQVTFLRVLPTAAAPDLLSRARRELQHLAEDQLSEQCEVEVLRSDDPLAAVAQRCEHCDLLVLGVQRHARRKKLFGSFTRELAQRTSCPIVVMSRRG
jgi:nucleotide-binding universal stress UspA family protein